MATEPRQKFSFSQAAAEQPQRQRFSFSQAAPQPAPTLNQSLDAQFPHRQAFIYDAIAQPPKMSFKEKVREFIVPSRGFTDEETWAAEPSLKENAVGSVKAVGEIGFGLSQLARMGFEKIPGYKKLFPTDEEFLAKIEEGLRPKTAGEAQVMRVADIAGFAPVGAVGRLGKLNKLDDIINASAAARNPKAARLVLKSAGASDKFIDTLKLDVKIAAANTPDEVFNVFKETFGDQVTKPRFSFSKAAATSATPVSKTTNVPVSSVARSVDGSPTPPKKFSFSETASRVPVVPVTPTTLSRSIPEPAIPKVGTKVLATSDDLATEARKYKSAEEFVKAQGTIVHHGGAKKIENINDIDFEDNSFYTLRRTDKDLEEIESSKGYFSPEELRRQPAEAFGKEVSDFVVNFNKPLIVDAKGKSWLDQDEEWSDWTSDLVAEARKNGNDGVILKNIKEGFSSSGILGAEAGLVDDYIVLDKSAIKTTSQLTDIYNQATKGGDSVAPSRSSAPKVVAQTQVEDIAASKKWEDNPVEAQKEATQKVAREYSNTDASKGFVTDAVNHIDNIPPIKNVTAKARNFAGKNIPPIDLPPETLRGWLQTRIQDSAYRLGLVQKKIVEGGGKISDDANAYMQREAYIGKASAQIGKFEEKLGMVAGNKNGLLSRAKRDGIDIVQLDEYMRARAAKARNARVAAKTDGKIADGGSGLTNKQADEILARYEGNETIANYANEFRDVAINARMKVLKDAGIYTDEQIAMITKGEPDYVPFKVAEFSRVQGGGKGFSVQSTGVKGLKGSDRTDRTNTVIQSVVDYEEAVIRAEKNRSLQSLAKLIRENPDDTLWEIKGVTYTPQYNKLGEMQFLRKNPINERTSVEFFENGKAYEIRFHDEALANVFTEQGLTKPIPGLIKINNYLRAVNTVINPEFMITNALRDLQTAIVTAGGEKGLVVAAKMVKDYPKASMGIWQAVRGEANTGWAKVYNEMVENGGRTGWFDLKDVDETTKEVSKRISRYNSDKTSDSLMRAVDSTGKLISDANEVFEMSIRTSAYKQMVDGGMSKVAAANYAKNMTVNFNKRGNWGMTLNSAYLFANAGIQGSARLLMALKYPKVRRITYGIVASAYGLNELNMKLNPEGYERIQDFEKERNIIVMLPVDGNKYNLPGISGDARTGYYLKMPLPYGFNVFKVAGDAAYDVVNKKKSAAEAMVQMMRAIDASFNPLSSGTPTQFITPTFADPFVSHWENKNWFGAPIMPEQPAFAPSVRDSDRYFSGARDLSVGTAQFLNRLTGGNEVTAGAVDISPETIDHVIDTLGGGLGNFLGQSVDGAVGVVKGDIPTPDEMPFIRKMIDTPFETGEQSTVFDLLEKSATERMTPIENKRFFENAVRALEMGQIDEKTGKRVLQDYITNSVRQEAGEVMSLLKVGKTEEAMEVIRSAPPAIAKELEKLIKSDIERELDRLQKQQQ